MVQAAARGRASRSSSTSCTTTPPRRASDGPTHQFARHRQRHLLPAHADGAVHRRHRMRQHRRTSPTPIPQRLVLDSLRYWANEVQIDGFRFDLAATLGRDAERRTSAATIRCCRRIVHDPAAGRREDDRRALGCRGRRMADRQLPAELSASGTTATATGCATSGSPTSPRPASRARRRSASAARDEAVRLIEHVRRASAGRWPRVNFVTAHDGFTAFDLTAYDEKHNLGNGENNRDGTGNNHSFNHGVEGSTPTTRPSARCAARRSATCSARCCCRPAFRCSPQATRSAAVKAATTTRTATTTRSPGCPGNSRLAERAVARGAGTAAAAAGEPGAAADPLSP